MTKVVSVDVPSIELTISILQAAGRRRHEGVVLWLGHRSESSDRVVEVIEPLHAAAADYFHIPPHGMARLMTHLGATETCIVAQVHSHPAEAFHSRADDEWAIVRHVGALSIVLPRFAHAATSANFLQTAAVFRLSTANRWQRVPRDVVANILEVR